MSEMPIYLDCNATVPLSEVAREVMLPWFDTNRPANSGSRTHSYGNDAKRAVNAAREQVAEVMAIPPACVIFTSGATEANNLALLGLASYGEQQGRRHIVSTQIEHKAVLEPLQELQRRGFEVTLVAPNAWGCVNAQDVLAAVRADTLLVSVMHANNETGMLQPIEKIADGLQDHPSFLHVDDSQAFGKQLTALRHERIDLISVSGHKIGGPIGVGALYLRKRGYRPPPIVPLVYGGGQERGLRPGTVPTALVVGFGAAAENIYRHHDAWQSYCVQYRESVLSGLADLPAGFDLNMKPEMALPNCVNLSIRDGNGSWLDAEAVLLALKPLLAASNGSACTSSGMDLSHVLRAQGLNNDRAHGAIRLSWCDHTPRVDWHMACQAIRRLL